MESCAVEDVPRTLLAMARAGRMNFVKAIVVLWISEELQSRSVNGIQGM